MTSRSIALARGGAGLLQGAALYALYRAVETKAWPATEPLVFAALLAIAVFIPVVVVAGLGNLRPHTLAAWALAAAACCAGLAVYDIYSEPLAAPGSPSLGPRLMLSVALWLSLGAILFIVHALVVAGDADRRPIAGYARLFDVAWKQGVQLALSLLFVYVFWTLLWLSASLFGAIGIRAVGDLLARPWFAAPATTVAFAYAIHVTDVRTDLVRGVRALALTLLAWLLPMMAAFAVAFLLALPFTGLQPLWGTRHAGATLLSAVAALVLLINAAYQDGRDGDAVAAVVRYARNLAALVLVPLVGLAAYALALRAQQYGWTPPRIIAGACVVVAGCYAAGYAIAALRPGRAMKGLEATNIATAFVIVAVVLCLFSPIADPSRIAVADQLRRLESGRQPAETFDYVFLKFHSGRYGRAALEKLAARTDGPHAAVISEKARHAMGLATPWQSRPAFRASPSQRAANIAVVRPEGQSLPDSFLRFDWASAAMPSMLPRCLTAMARCEALLTDLDGDGSAEVVLFEVPHTSQVVQGAGAFKAAPGDGWIWLGSIVNAQCKGVRDALAAGRMTTVDARFKELDADGIRLRIGASGCRQ